ncbi:glutamine-synthetase adenylyltransferase [Ketogulonicigenium vulgare]|uniref:[protein-PII] uridylyltransferase family protein n=1 Tax=Ketogulonicigenium vulgare TaxID=92945 RepID=UPI0023581315|nr:glutamine-synthetase adenylyltransferase [Ketogulonicigenium vulgare]
MTHDAPLANHLTRCPTAFDPARGADVVRLLPDLPADIAALIAGTAGSSPYLARLIEREHDWLAPALDAPRRAVDQVIAALGDIAPDILGAGLRQAKRRVALIVAVADLGGVWPLEDVTGALTRLADAATDAAMKAALMAEVARGKLPGMSADDVQSGAGMVALAMGKMGAGELNYSSDIDLICLFDDSRFDRDAYPDARASYVRATRKMTALLSDITAEGYVFRTDLRLRPDASVTPVCVAMSVAEQYYEAEGRTWERAAYIKARAAAGDLQAGARFLRALRPFVWRRHLDFAAIQDAHDMRLRIRDHKGLNGRLNLLGHNMKLGRGGIREIEFFTQTRQLIAGGRDDSLRLRGTVPGLMRLSETGWITPEVAEDLTDHYRAHRLVEHRLQMLNDAQTHDLPVTEEGFARLAAFMGISTADLKAELTRRIKAVEALTEDFFAPDDSATAREADFGAEVIARWPSYPALRSVRAGQSFRRLRPRILSRLQQAAKPEEALAVFDQFLSGLPAGVQLFALFEANENLLNLLIDICATAPALAQYLSRNAGVLDAVIGGSFFAQWPDDLPAELHTAIARAPDYEAKLDAARRWMKEWHFRIGVHFLQGLTDAEGAGTQYAALADSVLQGVWPVVSAEFARRHGAAPGRGAIVVGMGSLGAGRLHAQSDLDLILIYDAQGADASDGPRPLAVSSYFARLTQALVTALSAPMAEGRLYEVDMRLRPSGRQGPVATGWGAFRAYQTDEAWTWEHLAQTRARPIVGDAGLMAEFEGFRRDLLALKAGGAKVRADVLDMRARISAAKPPQGDWDAKIGPGRLQDIELFAETMALLAANPARTVQDQLAVADLPEGERQTLQIGARLFWQLQSAQRLLTAGPLSADALGAGGRAFLLRETGQPSVVALNAAIEQVAARAAGVIETHLSADGQSA